MPNPLVQPRHLSQDASLLAAFCCSSHDPIYIWDLGNSADVSAAGLGWTALYLRRSRTTDYQHYEIYAYTNGTITRDGTAGAAGIDINYGATPDLQLTFVVPLAHDTPARQNTAIGLGNVEIAAKYRILHQSETGWDVAIFPRLFLPSGSSAVGERHASLLLPIWLGRNWDKWSTFGGGGCVINRGGKSQDFCLAGWVLTRQVLPNLQFGVEVYHQTADIRGGRASSGLGGGLLYDVNNNYHLLASVGPGIPNAAETNRTSWYIAMLFTY